MSDMVNAPKWSLKNWRLTIDAQLNSWALYFPGVAGSKEIVEIKIFKGEYMSVLNIYECSEDTLNVSDGAFSFVHALRGGKKL